MKFTTNKEKGNCGLAFAIAYYTTQGYTVSIPMNDTQDYDLVVDKNNILYKIQIKATAQRSPAGYSVVAVKSCGGTNGSVYKTLINTNVDYLFVLTEKQEMYEIPLCDISTISTLNLGPERQCYRVDSLPNNYVKKEKESKINYCKECGAVISHAAENSLCFDCAMKERRVTERPDATTLAQEIVSSNFCAVGRKYGVSDNAIRKWCSSYGIPKTKKELEEWLSKQ